MTEGAAVAGDLSVRRSLAWMGIAQAVSGVLQFASSVVLAHYLSLHDAGIYAVALAIVLLLSLVQALGLQALIVREKELTADILSTSFTINALICIALALTIEGFSYWGGAFLGDAGVGRAMSALAVTPLFGIVAFLPAARLEREGRFREIALAATAGAIAGAVASIVLVMFGFSYMSMPYSQWLTVGVSALVVNLFGAHHASFRLGLRAWRRVGDFGLQMLAVSGVTTLTTRLSEIVIGRLLGLSALGIYNRASGLNNILWTNIHLLVGRVMLVDFAEVLRSGEPLRPRYLRTVEIVTVLLWPAFGGLAVLSAPFIYYVFGAKWVPAAPSLALIALGSMVQVAITMTWEVFAVMGELRTQTRIEFIRGIVAVAAFVAGAAISLEAAAAARLIDSVFAVLLYRLHLYRMTQTRFADFVPIYRTSGLMTLLACAPSIALVAAYRFAPAVPLALVTAAVLAGGLLWAAGLWKTRHPLGAEMAAMARRRRA